MRLVDDEFNDVYIVTHILKDGTVLDSIEGMVILYNESISPAYDILKECIIYTNQEDSLG